MTPRQAAFGRALKGSMNNLTPNIIFPLAEMYTKGPVCVQYCVWRLLSLLCECPIRWQAATSVSNVMCGSIIRTLCRTDTQPETWLLQLHFAGSLQYETCHLHIPPPPKAMETVIEAFLRSAAIRVTCLWGLLCWTTVHRLLFIPMMRFNQSRLSLLLLSKWSFFFFGVFLFPSIHTFHSHLVSIGSPLSDLPPSPFLPAPS